mgnify:CR=1 FL=1
MRSISMSSHLRSLKHPSLYFLGLSFLLRAVFFLWSGGGGNPVDILLTFFIGLIFDLSTLIYVAFPWILFGIFFPPARNELGLKRWYRGSLTLLILLGVVVFFISLISEINFWNEFHSRFNFIAVDYLVYTNEVFKNIWESYPMTLILSGIAAVAFAATWFLNKKILPEIRLGLNFKSRMSLLGFWLLLVALNFSYFPTNLVERTSSYVMHEVAENGLHSLFAAYFKNELDFNHFYRTIQISQAFGIVSEKLAIDGAAPAPESQTIGRVISSGQDFTPYNVVMVVMESMSARFMRSFGELKDLTPNLDRLARQGLFFNNVFATGTRTVRGLEALILSVPPTPGQSILRRNNNGQLFGLGDYLEDAGYQADFLYGGYGYFDNMNGFFSQNAFDIWDRAMLTDSEVSFSNAWGVCDEDLFDLSVRRADASYFQKKPFFQLVMTTSNHRPYTYPQKIDIPSGTGREGAVKYADFSIGEFVKEASVKPWFKSTIFIFVADHNASVAGSSAVPIQDYRIPFIVYAPDIVVPQKVEKLGSQIDVPPTILGLLHAKYKSHFFGHDLLSAVEERAFLGNYQSVGLLKNHRFTLLSPNQKVEQFAIGENDSQVPVSILDQSLVDEAIAYYQTASIIFSSGQMRDDGDDQIKNRKLLK